MEFLEEFRNKSNVYGIYELCPLSFPMKGFYLGTLQSHVNALGADGKFLCMRKLGYTEEHCYGLGITIDGTIFPVYLHRKFQLQPAKLYKHEFDVYELMSVESEELSGDENQFPFMKENTVLNQLQAQLFQLPGPKAPVMVALLEYVKSPTEQAATTVEDMGLNYED